MIRTNQGWFVGFGQDLAPDREVETRCILAMAHYRMNQLVEARSDLNRAVQLSRTKLSEPSGGNWGDYFFAQVLLREAKALIGYEAGLERGRSPIAPE